MHLVIKCVKYKFTLYTLSLYDKLEIFSDEDINKVVDYAKEIYPEALITYEDGTPIDRGDG